VRGTAELAVVDLGTKQVCFRTTFANPSRVALSPDGRWLAAAPWNDPAGLVRVWDVPARKQVAQFKEPNGTKVAFTADGKWLITGSANAFHFRDPAKSQPERTLQAEGQSSGMVAAHPTLPLAAVAVKAGLTRLINTDTLEEYATFSAGDPLAFSAGGDHLVTLDENRIVQVWDLKSLRQRLRAMNLDWD
jgi:WD40 repeat protein